MSKMQINFRLPAAYRIDDRTGMHVAYCPMLDVCSQGETEEESVHALRSALVLFLTHHFKHQTIDTVLSEYGFVPAGHPDANPDLGAISISEIPDSYERADWIDVPLNMTTVANAGAACPS